MVFRRADWKPPAVQAPDQGWACHHRGQAERGRAPGDRAEHQAAGPPDRRAEVSQELRYLAVIEHTEGTGYSAWAPDLPGCVAAADSREECERLMREAVALHLAGLREDGDAIPE